jgi:4-carboxymuconolactone decarboxylase
MSTPGQPRPAPVPFAEWDDDTRAVLLQHLRRPELYLSGAPDAPPMPPVLEIFAHHLALADSWMRFTGMLAGAESVLEPADRELLILRVAWCTRSGYEWVQHARMGVEAGLTTEQVDLVPRWQSSVAWTPRERSLLRATDDVLERSVVSEDTLEQLGAHFDAAQILEILFVIGGYQCLAAVLNSVGLQADLPPDSADTDSPAAQ